MSDFSLFFPFGFSSPSQVFFSIRAVRNHDEWIPFAEDCFICCDSAAFLCFADCKLPSSKDKRCWWPSTLARECEWIFYLDVQRLPAAVFSRSYVSVHRSVSFSSLSFSFFFLFSSFCSSSLSFFLGRKTVEERIEDKVAKALLGGGRKRIETQRNSVCFSLRQTFGNRSTNTNANANHTLLALTGPRRRCCDWLRHH